MQTIRNVSDLSLFFHRNEKPIYFIIATNFNLMGIDRWVRRFRYINYIDCFDGRHPNVFIGCYRSRHRVIVDGRNGNGVASSRTLPNEPEFPGDHCGFVDHHGYGRRRIFSKGSSQNRSIKSNRIGVSI